MANNGAGTVVCYMIFICFRESNELVFNRKLNSIAVNIGLTLYFMTSQIFVVKRIKAPRRSQMPDEAHKLNIENYFSTILLSILF
jgi:hypothetical protein